MAKEKKVEKQSRAERFMAARIAASHRAEAEYEASLDERQRAGEDVPPPPATRTGAA